MRYAFGEYVLDVSLYQLRHRDEVIPLEPKVFDVLRYLVEHHDRVATKRELLSALWPNEVVTEAVLPTNINALRRALGQKKGEKSPIETVHGRGYRFAMPVARISPSGLESRPAAARPSLAAGRPSLVDALEFTIEDELFVGQAPLMQKLKRSLARSLSGQGQVCILRGETGIGKSRIAKQICELARAHGAETWISACPEGPGTPPLWVWQDVVRAATAGEGRPSVRDYLGSTPEASPWLLSLLEEHSGTLTELGERERFGLYDAMVRLISGACRARPRMIWLEDMHRADEGSWQLLRLLAPHLESLPILVLCTVRSRDDLTTALPVQRNVDDLARLPFCHRFHVGPLEAADTCALVEKLFDRSVSAELARSIHLKTGGNPLFIGELVEWLSSMGGDDSDALLNTPNLAPPELVRHILARRVERLGEATQQVLESCAVLGTSFEAATAAETSELPYAVVLEALDRAVESGILVPVAERVQAYRFAHELVRDTLYSNLATGARRRMHHRAALHLEKQVQWLGGEAVRETAMHRYRSLPDGEAGQALLWLERAAQACERAEAFEEAARFYRFALDAARLLPEADPKQRETLNQAAERARARARTQGSAEA